MMTQPQREKIAKRLLEDGEILPFLEELNTEIKAIVDLGLSNERLGEVVRADTMAQQRVAEMLARIRVMGSGSTGTKTTVPE